MNKNDRNSLDKLLKDYNPKADGLVKYKEWKKKYKNDLIDYNYIHTLEEFQNLQLGGVIKMINLRNDEFKKGGILVKITKNNKNKWYALLSIPSKGYIWPVYFDTNYIFYRVPYHSININDDKTESFKNILDKFVNKDEINNYTEVTERDKHLKELIDRYKK